MSAAAAPRRRRQGPGGGDGAAARPGAAGGEAPSPLFTVCPYILGNELCERLAYYGLCTNLVVYFTTVVGFSTSDANAQVNYWSGVCYCTPLLGAFLSDTYLGRYKTIFLFSSVYLAGLGALVVSTAFTDPAWLAEPRVGTPLLFAGLYTIAVGTGGIKPCVSTFGADQFDMSIEKHRQDKTSFFNWFYIFINIGSLLASTVIVWVQENAGPHSWTIGMAIPAGAMVVAVVLFVLGSPKYVHMRTAESPISRVVKVVWAAVRNGKGGRINAPAAAPPGPPLAGPPRPGDIRRNESYAWLQKAQGDADSGVPGYSAAQVREVKLVLRLFPIFWTTVVFWCCYSQIGTLFVSQGLQMRRTYGGFTVPAATMSSLDTIGIIVLCPLYDLVVPRLEKRFGRKFTQLQRIGWGNVIAIAAMLVAALTETFRLRRVHAGAFAPGHTAAEKYAEADFSVAWQIPQYLLIAVAEVFASIGQLELFYDQAPDSMRSCCSALQLLGTALGSFLAGFLISGSNAVVRALGAAPWVAEDLNDGRLNYYFLLVAGLMAVNQVVYVAVALRFEYKRVDHGALERAISHVSEETPLLHGGEPSGQSAPIVMGGRRTFVEQARSLAQQYLSPTLPPPFK